jgi:hypothetical protein
MQKITIWTADVREVECDVLILKYAQAFYSADGDVALALGEDWRVDPHTRIKPQPHEQILIESHGQIAAKQALFVGVVPINEFEYSEIRAFARESLELISADLPNARQVAMTMQWVMVWTSVSFLAQLGGISDALAAGVPQYTISIVERDERRAERI